MPHRPTSNLAATSPRAAPPTLLLSTMAAEVDVLPSGAPIAVIGHPHADVVGVVEEMEGTLAWSLTQGALSSPPSWSTKGTGRRLCSPSIWTWTRAWPSRPSRATPTS